MNKRINRIYTYYSKLNYMTKDNIIDFLSSNTSILNIIYTKDGNGFVGYLLELPGVVTQTGNYDIVELTDNIRVVYRVLRHMCSRDYNLLLPRPQNITFFPKYVNRQDFIK